MNITNEYTETYLRFFNSIVLRSQKRTFKLHQVKIEMYQPAHIVLSKYVGIVGFILIFNDLILISFCFFLSFKPWNLAITPQFTRQKRYKLMHVSVSANVGMFYVRKYAEK